MALHVIEIIVGVLLAVGILYMGVSSGPNSEWWEMDDERNEFKYVAAINGRKW